MMVEPLRQVARELQVLALVLTHRDVVRVVEQDVGGLQDRVGEERDVGVLLAPPTDLVLELGHPAGLAEARQTVEHPRELGVLHDLALAEERRPLDVDTGCQELRDGRVGPLTQERGVRTLVQRVQVRDEVEGVVVLLEPHPLPQGPEVVPEVERVGRRLDAGQRAWTGAAGHAVHCASGSSRDRS